MQGCSSDCRRCRCGCQLTHEPLQNAGAQLGAAEAGRPAAQVGVKAGEGVLAGALEVAPGAGQRGRDAGGEGVEGGQGFDGGLLGADGFA